MSHKVDFEFKWSPVYRKGADGKNIHTAVIPLMRWTEIVRF